MNAPSRRHRRQHQRGQMIVIAVMSMITMIGGVALVLEAGNAYAHQREVQGGADSVANAGATVIAQRLGGSTRSDANVLAATAGLAASNHISSYAAYYTDVHGALLQTSGGTAPNPASAAQVGGGTIPPNTQGVAVTAQQTFPTTFGRVIGFNTFGASADATSVAGALTGGIFLPVVFPVNIVDCSTPGDLGTGEDNWSISEPGNPPSGQEYIVPLCKTDSGSFMLLNLDGTMNNCADEVTNPTSIQFAGFPVDVASDNGNNCAKPLVDAVNTLSGQVVLIPICDGDCTTVGGSHASYHVIRVAAFYLDYMSDQNGGTNLACVGNGTTLIALAGNGSSSCLVGWFVRYITSGPVGSGPITGAGSIGIQLVK
jgi:putative Flp pilus-assembly TadE/G-like protein